MRFIIILVLNILLLSSYSQNTKTFYSVLEEEVVEYDLSIGIFPIGKSILKYSYNTLSGERKMMAQAKSTGMAHFFYDFDFTFTNRLDEKTGLPTIATKKFKEGSYQSKNTVRFDHFSRTDSTIIYSDSLGMRVVPKNIFDILTGVYHLLNHEIKPSLLSSDTVSATCYFTDEVWNVRLVYIEDETIHTKRGEELCYKFYLLPQKGYFFKNDDDIAFWISKDGLNTPVKIRMNFVLSSIKAQISSYSNTLSPKRPINP